MRRPTPGPLFAVVAAEMLTDPDPDVVAHLLRALTGAYVLQANRLESVLLIA